MAVDEFPEARKPAYKLTIDFWKEIWVRRSDESWSIVLMSPEKLVPNWVRLV